MFSCHLNGRKDLCQFPGESLVCHQLIKGSDHTGVKLFCLAVNREHTGSLAYSQHLLTGKLPVDVTGQCGEKSHILYMLFPLQDRLIQMCDTPSLGNVKSKYFCQFQGCFLRHGVTPGTEGNQKSSFSVKGHIAMHHSGKSDGS